MLMKQKLLFPILLILASFACTSTLPSFPPTLEETVQPTNTTFLSLTDTLTPPAPTETISATATEASTEASFPSEAPSPLPTDTPLPTVESLKAKVTADRLSCRYGPGPEYLFLFGFRAGANIKLIGRVDAENWNWALVENQVPCWVKTDFLEVQGDFRSLPVVYPGTAKLPITPYYARSEVLSAERKELTSEVTISWVDVPVSLGDYEDDSMQTYIVELWRCQDGQLIFDPVGTRLTYLTFIDETGCSEPSHGQVWVQEKHGYAGPAEIPWPP